MISNVFLSIIAAIGIVFLAAYLGGMSMFQTCQEVDHDRHSPQ